MAANNNNSARSPTLLCALALVASVLVGGALAQTITHIPVLGYHQIDAPDNSYFSLPLVNFTQQMDMLVTLGYQTISPEQYVAWLRGNSTVRGCVGWEGRVVWA